MNKHTVTLTSALIALGIAGAPFAAMAIPVGGQLPTGNPTPVAPAVVIQGPAPVVQTGSVQFNNFVAPVITNINTVVFPKDITSTLIPDVIDSDFTQTALGIKEVASNLMPKDQTDSGEGILVRGDDSTHFNFTSKNSVKLEDGTILVSVRHPSRFALIDTPDGLIALNADGDVLVSYVGAVLRVENLSARGVNCKIQLQDNVLGGKTKAVALACGYELVASDQALHRGEIRPSDGIGRRRYHVFADGHLAVNEFNTQSALNNSSAIAAITSGNIPKKDYRVLADLCKMAAVLNYTHGSSGYHTAAKQGLAETPGKTQ
jgi:hypothetical protein